MPDQLPLVDPGPPAAEPAPSPPAERPPRRLPGPQRQTYLTTEEGWALRDGRRAWIAGYAARAAGERRCSPAQHGRLRRQWLAGWDAAERWVQARAAQMLNEIRASLPERSP